MERAGAYDLAMGRLWIGIFCIGLLTLAARGQSTASAPQSAATAPVQQSDAQLPRTVLGDEFVAEQSSLYMRAWREVEVWFAATSQTQRADILKQLESLKLPVRTIGRLTQLRASWLPLEAGAYYLQEAQDERAARYFLGVPDNYDRSQPWPLVIQLPPPNPFTTRPPLDLMQIHQMYVRWINEELARHPGALVLLPLLDLPVGYGPAVEGMQRVIGPLLHVTGVVHVDPQRAYLMGHSMGANATWNIGLHYPTYLAAIGPMAGGASADWQRLRMMNLSNVLVVCWQDVEDLVMRPEAMRGVVRGLRKMEVDVDYTETRGLGHAPPPRVVERLYQTMTARRRRLYPRQVRLQSNRQEEIFNRVDWVQVLKVSLPGPPRRLTLPDKTFFTVNQNACRVEATIDNNLVRVTTDNVSLLRLYFNAEMVDFSKPITIQVNDQVRWRGILSESLPTLLEDQLILGRGWRQYTAQLTLDLSGK